MRSRRELRSQGGQASGLEQHPGQRVGVVELAPGSAADASGFPIFVQLSDHLENGGGQGLGLLTGERRTRAGSSQLPRHPGAARDHDRQADSQCLSEDT